MPTIERRILDERDRFILNVVLRFVVGVKNATNEEQGDEAEEESD